MKISAPKLMLILSSIITSIILIFNWIYLREFGIIFQVINIFSIFIIIFPILLVRYISYKKRKKIEDMFPVFLRDFVEAIRSGMNLSQAAETVSKNDYGALSPYVKKMAAQLSWGFSVEKVLKNFAKSTNSKMIGRCVSSIIESHRFGGNIADTFEALSSTAVEIDRLREERKIFLHSQMITGYIIFFVFLGVLLALQRFLVPSLVQAQGLPTARGEEIEATEFARAYQDIFLHLILMQGFFAGLTVGKMAEGAMVAGLKHSIFMIVVGVVAFLIFGAS